MNCPGCGGPLVDIEGQSTTACASCKGVYLRSDVKLHQAREALDEEMVAMRDCAPSSVFPGYMLKTVAVHSYDEYNGIKSFSLSYDIKGQT